MEYWYIRCGRIFPLKFVKEFGNKGRRLIALARDDMPGTNIKIWKDTPEHADFGFLYPTKEQAVDACLKQLDKNIKYFEGRIKEERTKIENLQNS